MPRLIFEHATGIVAEKAAEIIIGFSSNATQPHQA
jgi:hypothetical protein